MHQSKKLKKPSQEALERQTLIGDSGAESKMLDTEVGEELTLQLLPKIESVDQCDKNTDLDSQSATVGKSWLLNGAKLRF